MNCASESIKTKQYLGQGGSGLVLLGEVAMGADFRLLKRSGPT